MKTPEKKLDGKSHKYYIWSVAKKGETKEGAIARILKERGLTMDEVGCMWIIGPHYSEMIDNGGYTNIEDLIGWAEVDAAFREIIENMPSTTKPPRR